MCQYCDTTKGTTLIGSTIVDGEGLTISLDAELGDLIVDAECETDGESWCDFMTAHIHYCPMCGRKLAD